MPVATLRRDLLELNPSLDAVQDAQAMLSTLPSYTCECWVRHCDYTGGNDFIRDLTREMNKFPDPAIGDITHYHRHVGDSTKALFLYDEDTSVVGRMVLNGVWVGPPDARVCELHAQLVYVQDENNFDLTKLLYSCATAFIVDFAEPLENPEGSPYTFSDNPIRQHITMVAKCPARGWELASFLGHIRFTLPSYYGGNGKCVLDSDVFFRKDVYVTHPVQPNQDINPEN